MENITLLNKDCYEAIKQMKDNSIDAIITDPPYDINFMGKDWDKKSLITNVDFWKECLRVLKHGGHLLAFGHSRTSHRTVSAIENAGFEIRDTVMWIYGSGFPKSHNVAIAIDKDNGAMKHRGKRSSFAGNINQGGEDVEPTKGMPRHEPITDAAKEWDGWGSALKPAHEPVVLARKPLDGTLANNCLEHGVGALNIDATRIGHNEDFSAVKGRSVIINSGCPEGHSEDSESFQRAKEKLQNLGRWPANVIFNHHEDCELVGEEEEEIVIHNAPAGGFAGGEENRGSEKDYRSTTTKVPIWKCVADCVVAELDKQSGVVKTGVWNETDGARPFSNDGKPTNHKTKKKLKEKPSGASKFFYCPKVGKKERNAGLDALKEKQTTGGGGLTEVGDKFGSIKAPAKNYHPTVKPVALMEYLIKLVTPEGATVLDPFMGSGTTGMAAKGLNRAFVGCEREKEYYEIAKVRIENW